jgi:integral membrane protein
MNTLFWLRIIAWIEGVTYLLLFITMPLKYMYDLPKPNYWVGMFHGLFFILYCTLVLLVSFQDAWSKKITFLSLLASLIPIGTFYAEIKWFRYK